MSRRPLRPAALAAALAAALVQACAFGTEPAEDVADLRGTWQYSGEQISPAVSLTGTLVIDSQSGDMISGQLGWQEPAPGGGTVTFGGPVSGRVIGETDVDFDVLLGAVARRHVGRLAGDTIRGAWVELASGRNGEFLAVRGSP